MTRKLATTIDATMAALREIEKDALSEDLHMGYMWYGLDQDADATHVGTTALPEIVKEARTMRLTLLRIWEKTRNELAALTKAAANEPIRDIILSVLAAKEAAAARRRVE